MTTPLAVVGGLFVLVYLGVAYMAIRSPLLGRLALREGIRRPGQTALVVGGLMVGAAAIMAALVGTDSAQDSSVMNAYRSWGETDLTITADDEVFPARVAEELAATPSLEGKIDGVQGGIEAVGSISNRTRKESDSGVRLVGFDPSTQEAFGPYVLTDGTRTYGEDLGRREVLVSRQLAENLKIERGDEIVMLMERVEDLDPTPKQLGNQLKATGKQLKALQKEAEQRIEEAATRAAERAAKAYVAQVTAQLEAQGAAVGAAYLEKIGDFKDSIRDSIRDAREANQNAGLPPGSIPPFIAEPEVPAPPTFTPPDPAAIAAGAQAAAASAAEEVATKLGDRYADRAQRLVDKLDDLKDQLDDAVELLKPEHLRVAGIAKAEGPGAYGLTSAVFARLATAQDIAGTDEINIIRVSGVGDYREGLEPASAALGGLQVALDERNAELELKSPLELKEVKADEIENAKDSSEFTFALLAGMSFLVLAAGVALVINLTQMLAEERRSRLATLRALGLTRRGLVRLSTMEGAFYSLLAAAVGSVVGIFAGRILAQRFGEAFAQFFGAEYDYQFVFSVRPATVATAFAAGALITLLTMYFAAWRTSRMSIPAAIRNLPEPAKERSKRRWPRWVRRGAFLAFGALNLASAEPAGKLIGGVIVITVLGGIAKGKVWDRLRLSVEGLLLAGWAFYMVFSAEQSDDPNKFFGVFTTAVLVAVVGLALATAANLSILERLTEGIAGIFSPRLRATVRPPMAYLARRTQRTGLSIIMFAVVMAIISMFSVFLFLFKPQYERDSLGYDVVISTPKKNAIDLPEKLDARVEGRADIRTRVYVGPFESEFQSFEQLFAPLYSFSDEQFADPPVRLSAKDEQFANDEEVWETVRTDPTQVVSNFGQPGDKITLEDEDGNPVTFNIAGTPAVGLFQGVIAPASTLEVFGKDKGKGWTSIFQVQGNQDVEGFAHSVEKARFKDGITSEEIRPLMERGYAANKTFFSVIDVLMKMGLIVGILSLGILGLRAVVERKHLIGVLRAIGYYKRSVLFGQLAEAFVTTTLGVLVGAATGFIMGWIFYTKFFEQSLWGVEWANLYNAIILVYGAVFLVTVGPAWRASRLPPAEAVRYTE